MRNAAIAEAALNWKPGQSTAPDQCLGWVRRVVNDAGVKMGGFGWDDSTYQAQWKAIAVEVPTLMDARAGDIIQWDAGGKGVHTAIVTVAGANPTIIDTNFGAPLTIGTGHMSDRWPDRTDFKIWRLGRV